MSDMETKVFLEEADVKKDFISDRKENGLKCPFCNQELRKISATSFLVCDNCNITGFDKLWQELIRTRKALEIIKKEMSNEYMPDFAVIRDALKGVSDE